MTSAASRGPVRKSPYRTEISADSTAICRQMDAILRASSPNRPTSRESAPRRRLQLGRALASNGARSASEGHRARRARAAAAVEAPTLLPTRRFTRRCGGRAAPRMRRARSRGLRPASAPVQNSGAPASEEIFSAAAPHARQRSGRAPDAAPHRPRAPASTPGERAPKRAIHPTKTGETTPPACAPHHDESRPSPGPDGRAPRLRAARACDGAAKKIPAPPCTLSPIITMIAI